MGEYTTFVLGAIIFVTVAIIFAYLETLFNYTFSSEKEKEELREPNFLITLSVVSIGIVSIILIHYLIVVPEKNNKERKQFLNIHAREGPRVDITRALNVTGDVSIFGV